MGKHVEMNRSQVQVIALCHRMWDVAIVAAEWETTSQHTARSCVVYVTKETVEAAEAILLTVSGVHGVGEHALRLAVVALRLAPEPSLNKPPTEAQYAPEAQQLQDPATLTHAQEAVAPEDPVKMGLIQITGVMMLTAGPALTRHISSTSLPTARHCVDYAAVVDPATAKTRTNGDIVRLVSNMLAPTTGTRTGLFLTARSCVDNARFLSPYWMKR